MILVTCYTRNDLDGAACVYAYAEFLQKKGINSIINPRFGLAQKRALFARPANGRHLSTGLRVFLNLDNNTGLKADFAHDRLKEGLTILVAAAGQSVSLEFTLLAVWPDWVGLIMNERNARRSLVFIKNHALAGSRRHCCGSIIF